MSFTLSEMRVLSESFEHRGDSILKVPSAVLWVDFRGTWKKQGENYCHHPGRNHGSFARVEVVKVGRRCHILDKEKLREKAERI